MADAVLDFYRQLIEHDRSDASLHAHLAQALFDGGDLDEARHAASITILLNPSLAEGWLIRAAVYKAQGCWIDAAEDFKRAAMIAPGRANILTSVATCFAEADRLVEAETWSRLAIEAEPFNKEAHATLGSVLMRLGQFTEAEAPCRAALAIDPNLISAHQNLSGILLERDPVAAHAHRHAAYQQQQVFIERAFAEVRRVLVLAAADAANVPLQFLLPRIRFTIIRWYIEYAKPDQEQELPPFDLVFNSIGDPDLAPIVPPAIAAFMSENADHLLNRPERVALTSRSHLPGLLAGIPGAVVPPALRYTVGPARLSGAVVAAVMSFPVLVRPIGSHGGEGLQKVDDAVALAVLPDRDCYATAFVDFRSADGWYRKYRAIYVAGEPYPYHLAISPCWLVHYWTSGMERDVERQREEQCFLSDPESVIGQLAMTALRAIGQRLGLDYGGIDFSVLPNGRLLVFEANATMLVHPEQDPVFAYRNPAIEVIRSAFERMIINGCRVPARGRLSASGSNDQRFDLDQTEPMLTHLSS